MPRPEDSLRWIVSISQSANRDRRGTPTGRFRNRWTLTPIDGKETTAIEPPVEATIGSFMRRYGWSLRDDEKADAAQRCRLEALRVLPYYDAAKGHLATLLFRPFQGAIARSFKARDPALESALTICESPAEDCDGMEFMEATCPEDPYDWVQACDDRMDLKAGMATLTPSQVAAVKLYVAGYQADDAARRLGIAVSSYRERLDRAEIALRQFIEDADAKVDARAGHHHTLRLPTIFELKSAARRQVA